MAKLNDICIINPKIPSFDDELEVSFIPMAKVSETGDIDTSEIKLYYEVKKGFTGFFENDVLFAKITPCMENGKSAIARNLKNNIGFGSTEFHVLRPDTNRICSEWLYYLISSPCFRNEAEQNMTGSAGQKRVPKTFLENFDVKLSSLDEQHIQVEILNKICNLVSLRKQQLSKLDELAKSRFVEMFGSIKNNIFGYPIVKIGSCAKLQGGFAFKSSDYLDKGVKLVQISNVNKDTLDWDSVNCVPYSFIEKYKDFELHVGDLVLAMTRPVIKSLEAVKIATVSQNDIPSLLNQRVGRFIVDTKKLSPVYLTVTCQMPEFREYVEAMSGNSLQPNISSKQVEDYLIILPPIDVQEQFALFVEQVDKSKSEIQKSIEKLEILKEALMQKYFG